MQFFVWENVLCDYTCGMICVMANDIDEAYKVIAKTYGENSCEYKEARTKPLEAFTIPTARAVYGGG